ncbi:hypothetical protein BGZ58_004955, partial [Dissophora ornata]
VVAPRPVTYATLVANTSNIPQLNTTYPGYATWFDDCRKACTEIQYSFDELIAAVSAAIFNNAQKNGASNINLKGDTRKHFTFKLISTCLECDDTSLDFPRVAIEQFTDAGIVAIDWELEEVPATTVNTGSSHKSDKGEDTNANTGIENNKSFVAAARGLAVP